MGYQLVERCDYNVGQIIANRYLVKKILGEGSYGKVYWVKDESGQDLALKLLRLWEISPDIREPLIKRFEVEFKTGQIKSDFLVQSLELNYVKGNPFIVMEFCPGGDLTPWLGTAKERAALICQQILLGLHALHINGKVHRDLKPENVLFKANGNAALTDFGIIGDKNHRQTERNWLGKPTEVFGTYAYMPPEQLKRARGGVTVLPTTDIFSFGVLAFQLLTNKYPFGELTSHNELAQYQRRIQKDDWNSLLLNTLPDGDRWYDVLSKCLCSNYKNRYQSVEEVLAVLPNVKSVQLPKAQFPSRNQSYSDNSRGGLGLRILQGESFGKIYSLSNWVNQGVKIITIGRGDNNVLRINEGEGMYVSRHHCCLEKNVDNQWLIRDGQWQSEVRSWKNSSNGTFVNSTEVSFMGHILKEGDIITIGNLKLRFENII